MNESIDPRALVQARPPQVTGPSRPRNLHFRRRRVLSALGLDAAALTHDQADGGTD